MSNLPNISQNNEQILNDIQSLQKIEQDLFTSLETNTTSIHGKNNALNDCWATNSCEIVGGKKHRKTKINKRRKTNKYRKTKTSKRRKTNKPRKTNKRRKINKHRKTNKRRITN